MLDVADNRTTLTALLGPTNTGKTHRAVERMLEHPSGMLGLPLRLLAREIYDRVSTRVGERVVALVTGEEKRIPRRPRYWVCTVESMTIERPVDFLAVDEIQLAVHPQRGHVFCDRLLRARGRVETWFMGADTMRPIVSQLVPHAQVQRHPRLSRLAATGKLGLGALPPRSAVIAFSAAEVYRLADRIRRRRGGAAVVLGALSPRTRNAQVAMYQAGEVDFLVATDAVGMGLNMDVDHVAFASLRKFDGTRTRRLTEAELAQIAGRAGRHTRDGTFGALAPLDIEPDTAFAIESHRFAPIRRVRWRNADLDLRSIAGLIASLSAPPPRRVLSRVERADDTAVLRLLATRPRVLERARGPEGVSLLWDVCRIPDFRKLMVEHHAALLEEVFLQLSAPRGCLESDFVEQRIARLEHDGGDIDALMMRMEFIRTWSYIVHHPGWVDDAAAWQERTRQAEDRLSDALHARLIERFVEQRGRRGRNRGARPHGRPSRAAVAAGQSELSGGPFDELVALRDALARKALRVPVVSDTWVDELVDAAHERFRADPAGGIWFDGGAELGRLTRGVDLLHPEVTITLARDVGAGGRQRILRRLRAWARDLVQEIVAPLRPLSDSDGSAALRGLGYQLEQALGTVSRRRAAKQLTALSGADRRRLDEIGVVLGRRHVYLASALTAPAVSWRLALCAAQQGRSMLATSSAAPLETVRSVLRLRAGVSRQAGLSLGYALLGGLAVRVDAIEQLAAELGALAKQQPFALPAELSARLQCQERELHAVLRALGYRFAAEGWRRRRRGRRRGRRPPPR